MDRFFDILRAEVEKELSCRFISITTTNTMLASFDRAFAKAVVIYAREKGVDLT